MLLFLNLSCWVYIFLFFPQSLKAPDLKDRLEESEKLIQEMTITWEEKLRKTEEVAQVKHTRVVKVIRLCMYIPIIINQTGLLKQISP